MPPRRVQPNRKWQRGGRLRPSSRNGGKRGRREENWVGGWAVGGGGVMEDYGNWRQTERVVGGLGGAGRGGWVARIHVTIPPPKKNKKKHPPSLGCLSGGGAADAVKLKGWMGGCSGVGGAGQERFVPYWAFFPPLFFQFCLILSAKLSCRSWFHVLNSLNNNNLLVHSRACELRLGFFFFFLFILWETEWMQSQWRSPKKLWHPLKRLFKNPNLLRKCLGPHTHMTAEADFTVFAPDLVVCDVTWATRSRISTLKRRKMLPGQVKLRVNKRKEAKRVRFVFWFFCSDSFPIRTWQGRLGWRRGGFPVAMSL